MTVTDHPIVSPYTLKTASVIFQLSGATTSDDFSDHIGEITLNPSAQSGSWVGVTGNTVSDQATATWAATLGLIQDLDDASLLRWLLTNEGQKATCTAVLASGKDTLTFTFTVTPAQIGGAAGSTPLSSSVTVPIDGKPAFA